MELILRPKRLRFLWLAALSAGLVAGGALMVRESAPLGWAPVLFFGFCVVVFCLLLLPGSAYLKLDPTGFTVCSLYRAHSVRWDEVDSFEVITIERRKVVVFNLSHAHQGQEIARKLSSAISGYEVALSPETYGLCAEEFAAMMNDWRQRKDPTALSEADYQSPL